MQHLNLQLKSYRFLIHQQFTWWVWAKRSWLKYLQECFCAFVISDHWWAEVVVTCIPIPVAGSGQTSTPLLAVCQRCKHIPCVVSLCPCSITNLNNFLLWSWKWTIGWCLSSQSWVACNCNYKALLSHQELCVVLPQNCTLSQSKKKKKTDNCTETTMRGSRLSRI